MPLPRLGELDAAGLLAAKGGEHELALDVGMLGQQQCPGLPADRVPALAAGHLRLAAWQRVEPLPVLLKNHGEYPQSSGSLTRTSADCPAASTSIQLVDRASGGTMCSVIV